jgi:hypothetical protein
MDCCFPLGVGEEYRSNRTDNEGRGSITPSWIFHYQLISSSSRTRQTGEGKEKYPSLEQVENKALGVQGYYITC